VGMCIKNNNQAKHNQVVHLQVKSKSPRRAICFQILKVSAV